MLRGVRRLYNDPSLGGPLCQPLPLGHHLATRLSSKEVPRSLREVTSHRFARLARALQCPSAERKEKASQNMHSPRKRRGGPSRKAAAALVFAACLGQGAGSSPGYPGASTGGANPMPQRQGQPVSVLHKPGAILCALLEQNGCAALPAPSWHAFGSTAVIHPAGSPAMPLRVP